MCSGLVGPLGPSVLGVAQTGYEDKEEDRPWLQTQQTGGLCELGPLVPHLNDFRKTEETTGIIDLTLCGDRVGSGWRSFTGFVVGGGILEDSKLLLGDLLTTDFCVG